MSKELTPLEALEDLIKFIGSGFIANTAELCEYVMKRKDIIETAFKTLDQIQIILGAEKLEDLPCLATTIDNELYSTSYKLKQNEKKLKAFKIIKEKQVNVGDFVFYKSINKVDDMILPQETIIDLCCGSAKNGYLTQEEYDLLKGEL